jgi:hypothetical protein
VTGPGPRSVLQGAAGPRGLASAPGEGGRRRQVCRGLSAALALCVAVRLEAG